MADDKSLNAQRKKARKTPAINTGLAGIGKKPPQAIELEEAVLGACMLEQTAVNAVIDILEPAAFYKEAHGEIYKAIKDLFGEAEPIEAEPTATANGLSSDGRPQLSAPLGSPGKAEAPHTPLAESAPSSTAGTRSLRPTRGDELALPCSSLVIAAASASSSRRST